MAPGHEAIEDIFSQEKWFQCTYFESSWIVESSGRTINQSVNKILFL